jgi:hypothetical protein
MNPKAPKGADFKAEVSRKSQRPFLFLEKKEGMT